MARGITQDQVNAAADAILSAGENPTVEKVRIELGTGSPNTITRMLDVWRGQLGERLRQLSSLPEVPIPVGQAMVELWQLSTIHAERVLEDRFASDRSALAAARAQLDLEREGWEVRLQVAETSAAQAKVARELAEHACATLDGQLQDSHALRADLLLQRDRLQEQCDQQSAQNQALRTQLEEQQGALRAERDRQEAHVRVIEDRSHLEVDRARQEAKHWQQRSETTERVHRDDLAALQTRHDAAIDQARRLEQESARQAGQIIVLEKALSQSYVASKRRNAPSGSKMPVQGGKRSETPVPPKPSKQPKVR